MLDTGCSQSAPSRHWRIDSGRQVGQRERLPERTQNAVTQHEARMETDAASV